MVGDFIFAIVFWSTMILCAICFIDAQDLVRIEFLNPIYVYKNFKVNYFGCTILTIIFNLICPLATICYWFYKLCTVGRK